MSDDNNEKSSKGWIHPTLNTIFAGLALLISAYTLRMQMLEKQEKHAQVMSYELGTQKVNDRQVEDYFKIYNYSEGDIYLESVRLKADMSDGIYDLVDLYEPSTPKLLHPGEFKAFRFRMPFFMMPMRPRRRAANSPAILGDR